MRKDGFINEKLYVIPKEILLKNNEKYVTDIGYFPAAKDHYRSRPYGANEHILMICVNGKGYVNNKVIETNSLVFIPEKLKHVYRASAASPWDIYWVHFKGSTAFPNNEVTVLNLTKFQIRSLSDMFLNMLDAFEHEINEVSLNFVDNSISYMLNLISFYRLEPPKLPKIIRKANSFVKDDLSRSLSIDEICEKLTISSSTLYNAYKKQYNLSPIVFFTQLKMDVAANYLISTSMKINQVGNKVGYYDPYYFSRIFKKIYGVSPKRFRTDNT